VSATEPQENVTKRLGVLVGLVSEARALERASRNQSHDEGPLIRVCGGRPAIARRMAEELVRVPNIAGLVSFGIAGALDPALPVGALVLPDSVRDAEGRDHSVHMEWRDRLAAVLPEAIAGGRAYGSETMIADVAGKAALHRSAEALIVDMESHILGEAARAAGLPFLIVRAVSDHARRDLPPTAFHGTAPDGSIRHGAVVARLMTRPQDLPGLVALGMGSARAHRALGRAALLGGRLLALVV
jgi:hopanoid-associated phosphorylase